MHLYYRTDHYAAANMAEDFDNIDHVTQTAAVFASLFDLTAEDESLSRKREGSRPVKKVTSERNFEAVARMLKEHYFAEFPLYDDKMLRHCFRLSRLKLEKCSTAVVNYDDYLNHKKNCALQRGLRWRWR